MASAARDEEALGNVLDLFGRYRMLTFDRDPLTRRPDRGGSARGAAAQLAPAARMAGESRERLLVQRRLMSSAAEWQAIRAGAEFPGERSAPGPVRTSMGQHVLAPEHARSSCSDVRWHSPLRNRLTWRRAWRSSSDWKRRSRSAGRELALQKRAASRLRYLVAGLAVFLVVAAGLAVWALNRSQVAQANEQLAQDNFAHADALRVAAEANNLLSAHGPSELIALLSIRSMNMQYSPQADATLSQAAYLDYPVRRFSHGAAIWDLTFSPDGKYLVTAGADHAGQALGCRTGQQVRTLAGHRRPLQ